MKKILLFLTSILFLIPFSNGQITNCTGSGGNDCSTPIQPLCDANQVNNLVIDMASGNPVGPSPLCGSGAINNVSWYGFTAASTTITFELTVENCTDPSGMGEGIQYGVYPASECGMGATGWGTALICNAALNPPGTNVIITSSGYTPGTAYVLFIDGWGGSVCDLTITLTDGDIDFDVQDPTTPAAVFDGSIFTPALTGNEVCLGGVIDFNVTQPAGQMVNIGWTIQPPSIDYPTGVILDVPDPSGFITVNFNEAGVFQVCAVASDCCDVSEYICYEVEVIAIPDLLLGTFTACPEEITSGELDAELRAVHGWLGDPILNVGSFSQQLEDPVYSCDFFQSVEVMAYDPEPAVTIDTLVCGTPVLQVCNTTVVGVLNGNSFFDVVTCIDFDDNGCDQEYNVNAYFVDVQGFLSEPECRDGQLVFTWAGSGVNSAINNGLDVTYTLYRDGFVVFSESSNNFNYVTDEILVPIDEGQYVMEVTISYGGQQTTCPFTSNSVNVSQGNLLPSEPEIEPWGLTPCIQDSLSYSLTANNDPNSTYLWNITPPDGLVISDDSSSVIGINWSGSNPNTTYTICVSSDNGCGTSDPTCEDLEVLGAPMASYTSEDTICITDQVVVQYNGTNITSGDYTWNFDGGTIDLPDANSPGPFNVTYATSGKKIVSVFVNQGSCVSEVFVDSIEVVTPLSPPVVNCGSETDSIGFSWNNLADGYIVNVLDAPGTAVTNQNGNVFSVTNLNPLDTVTIEVIAIDNGACGNVSTIVECVAQSCPPLEIELSQVDTICLNSNADVVDLNAIITPAQPVFTEDWQGNGIVDATDGIFDPSVAQPGTHQITYTYMTDCPYTDALTIVVLEQPVSTFQVEDTICITDFVTMNYTGNFASGQFNWDFDGGNATGMGSGPFDISWDTPGLKTISLSVRNISCESDLVTRTVLVEPELEAPNITCEPNPNDILFSWDAVENATEYEIFINGMSQGIQTGTDFFVDNLIPGNMVDITVVALSDNACPNESSFLPCEALNCPPVFISLSSNETSICLTDLTEEVQIDLNVDGGLDDPELTWVGPGIDQNGMFDPQVAGLGTHEIIINYFKSNCEAADTIYMTVLATPEASFTANSTLCLTDTLLINFNGEIQDIADFNWTIENGGISGDDPGPYMVWFDGAGTFDIELVLNEAGCESEPFSQSITVDEEIVMPDPGIECDPTTSTISFNWPDIDCVDSYNVFVNNQFLDIVTGSEYTIFNAQASTNYFFQIIANSPCACGNATFDVICSTEACPILEIALADVGSFCAGDNLDPVQLQADVTGNPSALENESWSGVGVDDSGMFDPAEAGTGNHVITYEFDIDNCSYSESFFVTVFGSPNLELDGTDPSCLGQEDGQININASGGSGDYTFFVNNEEISQSAISDLPAGSYTVLVVDDNDCSVENNIVLTEPIEASANIAGNTTVISSDTNTYSVSLDTEQVEITDIVWADSTGAIICSGIDCETIDYAPVNDVQLCATVTYNNGCVAEDCISIRAEKIRQVYIPNIFTPNDDGFNDLWLIYPNEEIVSIPLARVYNRWGEKMFERIEVPLDGTGPAWDGTFKGRSLNPGVYVYQISVVYKDGTTEIITGDMTITK